MTLAPIHSHLIRGVEGKPGPLPKTCVAPGCLRVTRDRHHLWAKSYLRGQPIEYVRTPWDAVIQNSTGLCVEHHSMVTDHHAAIMVEGTTFYWAERSNGDWQVTGALRPQPGEAEDPHSDEPHTDLAEGESCPTCGYQKPRESKPGPKRPTKTWALLVPDDTELGGEVLDGWVDDFAVLLGLTGQSPRLKRYHVLAVILAWASQHKPMLIEDIIESRR